LPNWRTIIESRHFIRQAADLQRRIKDLALAENLGVETSQDSRQQILKDLTQTFTGLQNPTLPSAYKLRDAALQAGYTIDPKILHRIQLAEGCWQ
jgi:hypothetical protein